MHSQSNFTIFQPANKQASQPATLREITSRLVPPIIKKQLEAEGDPLNQWIETVLKMHIAEKDDLWMLVDCCCEKLKNNIKNHSIDETVAGIAEETIVAYCMLAYDVCHDKHHKDRAKHLGLIFNLLKRVAANNNLKALQFLEEKAKQIDVVACMFLEMVVQDSFIDTVDKHYLNAAMEAFPKYKNQYGTPVDNPPYPSPFFYRIEDFGGDMEVSGSSYYLYLAHLKKNGEKKISLLASAAFYRWNPAAIREVERLIDQNNSRFIFDQNEPYYVRGEAFRDLSDYYDRNKPDGYLEKLIKYLPFVQGAYYKQRLIDALYETHQDHRAEERIESYLCTEERTVGNLIGLLDVLFEHNQITRAEHILLQVLPNALQRQMVYSYRYNNICEDQFHSLLDRVSAETLLTLYDNPQIPEGFSNRIKLMLCGKLPQRFSDKYHLRVEHIKQNEICGTMSKKNLQTLLLFQPSQPKPHSVSEIDQSVQIDNSQKNKYCAIL